MQLEGRIAGSPTMDSVTITDPDPALAGTWPLAALAVEAVFMALTEPLEPAVPKTYRRQTRGG